MPPASSPSAKRPSGTLVGVLLLLLGRALLLLAASVARSDLLLGLGAVLSWVGIGLVLWAQWGHPRRPERKTKPKTWPRPRA